MLKRKICGGEAAITTEHVQNNSSVRSMLGERGIREYAKNKGVAIASLTEEEKQLFIIQ